jgi:hypothetical protein
MRLFGFALPILWLGCSPAEVANPCPQGICVGGGGDAGGAGRDGASGGPCVEAWSCTQWAPSGAGMYTRTCADTNRCGTTATKPSEGPIGLPKLDLSFYKCRVEPIVDRGCAMMGCHGLANGDTSGAYRIFARGRRRNSQQVPAMCLDSGPQDLAKGSGTVMCYGWSAHTQEEWQANFDSARALMLGVTNPDDSDLLAQPVVGGKAHTGVHLFSGKGDPDYQTIKAWLGGAALPSCDPQN